MTLTYDHAKVIWGTWYPCYYQLRHLYEDLTINSVIFCKTRRAFAKWIEEKETQKFGFANEWKFLALEFDDDNPLTAAEIYEMNDVCQDPTEIDDLETFIK